MSQLKPFRAFRPKPDLSDKVASVPYDVINTKEACQLAEGNPYSFLHVCRPEIDLPITTDIHSDAVYEQGKQALYNLIKDGILFQDEKPCLYIYQQQMGDHIQSGLVGLCSAKEYEDGSIKRHEYTRKDKEDDRTRHIVTQNANAEPVFLTYKANNNIDAIINQVKAEKPIYDIVTPDKIGHKVWIISNETQIDTIITLFKEVPNLYIADGHHRTAAAIRYAQHCRNKNIADCSSENFMAVLFPHNQLKIMDYNRIVKDLNGHSKKSFIEALQEKFIVTRSKERKPNEPATFGMYIDNEWYLLKAKPGSYPIDDPVRSLDVSILQENVLSPILGIEDPRTDTRIDFIGGIRGMDELEQRVNNGYAIAFSMFPTSLDQLMSVANANQVMPPKSTWFEPKLRSGLLVRLYKNSI